MAVRRPWQSQRATLPTSGGVVRFGDGSDNAGSCVYGYMTYNVIWDGTGSLNSPYTLTTEVSAHSVTKNYSTSSTTYNYYYFTASNPASAPRTPLRSASSSISSARMRPSCLCRVRDRRQRYESSSGASSVLPHNHPIIRRLQQCLAAPVCSWYDRLLPPTESPTGVLHRG